MIENCQTREHARDIFAARHGKVQTFVAGRFFAQNGASG
jgi:hypothetical protein